MTGSAPPAAPAATPAAPEATPVDPKAAPVTFKPGAKAKQMGQQPKPAQQQPPQAPPPAKNDTLQKAMGDNAPQRDEQGRFRGQQQQEAPEAEVEEAPEAPAPQKFKVKVAGQEVEVTHEELLQSYQVKGALDKRLREVADWQKKLDEYDGLGKKDFKSLVARLAKEYNADPEKVAQEMLVEKANKWIQDQELAKLTPEERQLVLDAQAYREQKAAKEKADAEKAQNEQQAQGQRGVESTNTKLIEVHKLLPESIRGNKQLSQSYGLKIIDALMSKAANAPADMPVEHFLAQVNPQEMVEAVLGERLDEAKLLLKTLPPDVLEALIEDPELAEKWTARLRAKMPKPHPALQARPQTRQTRKQQETPPEENSYNNFRDSLDPFKRNRR